MCHFLQSHIWSFRRRGPIHPVIKFKNSWAERRDDNTSCVLELPCVCLGKVCEVGGVYSAHVQSRDGVSFTHLTGKLNFLRPCHAGGSLESGASWLRFSKRHKYSPETSWKMSMSLFHDSFGPSDITYVMVNGSSSCVRKTGHLAPLTSFVVTGIPGQSQAGLSRQSWCFVLFLRRQLNY